ncbi:MAG: prephenate dehydratase [Sporomusaceae bacterium]|nr:prephenate dehydratase [Sporomusaceae bacterium]
MTVIGYLGPEGTYSEESVKCLYSEQHGVFKPYPTIDGVIRALAAGEITECVVPIENSLEGAVNVTLDLLAHEVNLSIIAELILPIRHNLLLHKNHKTKSVKRILSHPQALAQCRQTLFKLYPDAVFEAVASSAEAASIVAQGGEEIAAVGSRAAAARYGLTIAAADVQDSDNNSTRFIALRQKSAQLLTTESVKTSVICQMNGEKPGSLCDILQEFSRRQVNLTRIESRPARTGLGNYIFFFDLAGASNQPIVAEALRAVEKKCLWFKFLGSYGVRQISSC